MQSPEEQSFDKQFFCLFGQFIEFYCSEMMPDGFRFADWPLYLKNELVFTCPFFLCQGQFKEPYKKLKPVEVTGEPPDAPIRVEYLPQVWMSQEHYLAAHQHTTDGAAFVLHLLSSSSTRHNS